MWEEIFKQATSNGIFAVMFVGLLVYLLKDSKKREEKYTFLIEELTKRLEVVVKIKEDTQEILEIDKKRIIKKDRALKVATSDLSIDNSVA